MAASFRIIKDSVSDSQSVSNTLLLPGLPSSSTGSIWFDSGLNRFYGRGAVNIPMSSSVVGTIPVGVTPAGLAITPDGTKAYVCNNNNYAITNGDSVSVIDLATNKVIATVLIGAGTEPYTATVNEAGTKVYITNSNFSTVTVIDVATNTVSATITGFDGPSGLAIVPGTNIAYVNNYGGPPPGVGSGNGTTVRRVDLLTNTIVGGPITVDQAPAALAATATKVYVINYVTGATGSGTMSVINVSDNTVTTPVTGLSGPFAISISPDETKAYITNFGSNNFDPIGTTLSVVNLLNNTIVATIGLGIQPSGLAITPDGTKILVSNYNTLYSTGAPSFTGLTAGQGTVQVIDSANNEVVELILVGQSPSNIAITPDGTRALVSNYTSNTVSIITF